MVLAAVMLIVPALAAPALAQQSANFKLTERVFNAGGHPNDGVVMESTNFKITLDALGGSVVQSGMNSTSYRMDACFTSAYAPPGEVTDLRFSAQQTLRWNVESSRGVYNLYRDLVSNLSGLGYGICEQPGLPDEMATDSDLPLAGDTYFYLITVENRLGEEGTKGFQGDGVTRRQGTTCP
jgi:hypothetical protein